MKPLRENWVFMTSFDIYADESGKLGKNTDFTSFCGYIAHTSEWERFRLEWDNARLRFQVPPIHMSRIMNPDSKDDAWRATKSAWGRDWEQRRDLMLNDFAKILLSAQVICVGAVVDAAHFRHLCEIDSGFKERFRDPLYMALQMLVVRGIEKTEVIDKHSPIGIVIDEDEQFAMGCYEYINQLKRDIDKVRDRVHSVSFVKDDSFAGVQAADMIAFESRSLMVARKKNPDHPISSRFWDMTLLGIHMPKLYTAEVLDILRAEMPRKIAGGNGKESK